MSSTSPSELFTEALSSFSKSAQQAFLAVDAQARTEAARVNAELRQLRLEKDKAVDALHTCQLESESWKQEAATCQANFKQAELKIAHQNETIAQLRREANQWKDQSRNWQEHFLRVEQERCSLTTRLEELVTQSLQNKRQPTSAPVVAYLSKEAEASSYQPPSYKSAVPVTPFEPESPSAPSTSTTRQRRKSIIQPNHPVSSPARTLLPPYEPSSSTPNKNQTGPSKKRRISPKEPISAPVGRIEPRQTLIRRVHAVVNVKQEPESEEESSLPDSQGQVEEQATRPSRSARRKSAYVLEDESGSESGDGNDDDYVEDEEDELLIGAEPNHKELHTSKRVTSSRTAQDTSASVSKKRKHDAMQKSVAATSVRRRA